MSVQRHTAYNLLGSVVPMLVSVLTVPLYLHLIGDVRYGILAIVWLFLGYFGLFDPGITRAALFHIARLSGRGQERERESVFWTALTVNLAFGIVGGVVLFFAAKTLFVSTFKMPADLRAEVLASLPWLVASVPVSIVTGVLGGALQARECFGLFNAIFALNALTTQIVPLAVAYFYGPKLTWLIPSVLIARALGCLPSMWALWRHLPLGAGGRYQRSLLRELFSYGGWVTITNLINPLLTSMDRMLIGGVLGAESVAFYTVPFNLVSRASVVPGSLATSLFPKLSRGTLEDSARLAEEAVTVLSAVMTLLIVIAIACTPLFMRLWVGSTFAVHAAPVGIILFVGIWANSLAFIPYEHLQAINRPDLPAKFHAAEVVPFLALLWVGLHYFGLLGAAWAWSLRVTVDAILLFVVAGQTPGWQKILPGAGLVLLAAACAPMSLLSVRTVAELAVLTATLVWSWRVSPVLQARVRVRWARLTLKAQGLGQEAQEG